MRTHPQNRTAFGNSNHALRTLTRTVFGTVTLREGVGRERACAAGMTPSTSGHVTDAETQKAVLSWRLPGVGVGGERRGREGREGPAAGRRSFQSDSSVPDLDGGDGFTSECRAKPIRLHLPNWAPCVSTTSIKLLKEQIRRVGK